MVTKLKKPVTRRIGERVVSIEAEGVRVRRLRRRASILLPWPELEARIFALYTALKATTRKQAFAVPLPRGWFPLPGERVFVRGTRIGRGIVLRSINAVPEVIVRVRLIGARGATELQTKLSDVRPHRRDLEEEPLFTETLEG